MVRFFRGTSLSRAGGIRPRAKLDLAFLAGYLFSLIFLSYIFKDLSFQGYK